MIETAKAEGYKGERSFIYANEVEKSMPHSTRRL